MEAPLRRRHLLGRRPLIRGEGRARIGLALLALFLTAANALIWTEFLLYSQNTLLLNGRWIGTKRTLEMYLTGSDSFLIARTALHRNRLDLSAFYGGNEVLWRLPLRPSAIAFDFQIEERGELSVLFDKTADGFAGLKLAAGPEPGATLFRASPDGRFTSSRALTMPLISGRRHRMDLRFEAGRLSIGLDGREVAEVEETLHGAGLVGFRGGLKESVVDDVVIRGAEGSVWTESFSNRESAGRALALNAAALGLVLLAWLAAARLAGRRDCLKPALLRFAAGSLALAGVGATLFFFDFFYWSGLPLDSLSRPLNGLKRTSFSQAAEAARRGVFTRWYHAVGGRTPGKAELLGQGYPDRRITAGPIFCGRNAARPAAALSPEALEELLAREKTAYRVLFIGSSQTIGAGAQRLSETFFARVHRALAADFGTAFPIESLNAAVSGTNARASFGAYRHTYLRFKPDLVVINFSINGDLHELRSGLGKHLRADQAEGIATILVKEAVSPRAGRKKLGERHRIVAAAARRYGAEVYDLDGHLNDARIDSTGFLWWDSAHLTSHGQAVAARWLAPKLAGSIRRARKDRGRAVSATKSPTPP